MTTININNQTIEEFLYMQTTQNNISTVDYLTKLIFTEMEILSIKQDIKTIKSEVKKVNEGKIKLRPARLLLDEL